MGLILAELRRQDYPFDKQLEKIEVDLFNGDMIESGRGEMLIRVTD